MEPIGGHIPAFDRLSCIIALGPSDQVTHMFLADLLRFFCNTFDRKEALEHEVVCHFWIPIVTKWSEVED